MKSIRYKMGLSYFVLVGIVIASTIIVAYNVSQLTESVTRTLLGNVQSVLAAENMVKALERQQDSYSSYVATGDTVALSLFLKNREEFVQWFYVARGSMALPSEPSIVDSIARTYRSYDVITDSIRTLKQRGYPQEMAVAVQRELLMPLAERLNKHCQRLVSVNHGAIIDADRIVRETSSQSTITVLITSILAIILSIIAAVQFNRSISKPAETLTQTVRNIGRGNLNQKIDITTDDEIGELGREFNKMTERLRVYEEMNISQLLSEKKKTEEVVANIPDPVLVTSEDGQLQVMNQAAEQLLGVGGVDWRDKPLREIFFDNQWHEFLSSESEITKDPSRPEQLLTIGEGNSKLYFRPRRRVIRDDRGNIQGVATLLQDVTQFRNLDQMKSEFLATVSHEFRTPLTSLNMSVDILSQELLGPVNDRQRELLGAAKDDCERLKKFVTELLDLSRLESGRYKMKTEPVVLMKVIENAVKPLQIQFREKNVRLETSVGTQLHQFSGDERQLSWVVTNLISNALRYSPPGETLRVEATEIADMIRVCVEDSGRGIPEEMRETIFEKFVQIKEPSDSTPGSVGLGLAIAREIVEAHHGRIWVESSPGKGSRFIFTIPIQPLPTDLST